MIHVANDHIDSGWTEAGPQVEGALILEICAELAILVAGNRAVAASQTLVHLRSVADEIYLA